MWSFAFASAVRKLVGLEAAQTKVGGWGVIYCNFVMLVGQFDGPREMGVSQAKHVVLHKFSSTVTTECPFVVDGEQCKVPPDFPVEWVGFICQILVDEWWGGVMIGNLVLRDSDSVGCGRCAVCAAKRETGGSRDALFQSRKFPTSRNLQPHQSMALIISPNRGR